MQPVILDTDVASLTHKRKLSGPLATRLVGRKPLITFITFGELTKWTEIRHWGTRRRQDVPLATLNLKDYKDFQTHHGLRMLGAE